MDRAVQRRVRAHDNYQVEFKLEYPLSPHKRTRYQIATYIFAPQSLAIREETYPPAEFYRHIQNYVRLRRPRCGLFELRKGALSPLGRLAKLVDELQTVEPVDQEPLIESLKWFRAILKRSLRAELQRLRRGLGRSITMPECRQWQETTEAAIDEAKAVADDFRTLGLQLMHAVSECNITRVYRLADEAISLVLEDFYLSLHRTINQQEETDWRCATAQRLECEVDEEITYRRAAGYASILQPAGDNEHFLHRISLLKKTMSSVLYLTLKVQREGTALEQILFAAAAGLSMIFATLVAFYFQARYGIFTFPVFVALVVGYMFKDRIKEMARSYFAHHLRQFLFDRRILIYSLDGKARLGVMREKVTYLEEDQAPASVLAVRKHNQLTEFNEHRLGESIICYSKEVILERAAFRHINTRGATVDGVTDIMRHDIRPYLNKMDDPVELRPYLHDGVIHLLPCAKVYYLHIVTVYTSGGKNELQQIKHTRVALTRDGIKRVEQCKTAPDEQREIGV
jgi:hypothetical protein